MSVAGARMGRCCWIDSPRPGPPSPRPARGTPSGICWRPRWPTPDRATWRSRSAIWRGHCVSAAPDSAGGGWPTLPTAGGRGIAHPAAEVDATFEAMAGLSGPGSANRRSGARGGPVRSGDRAGAGVPARAGARRSPAGGDGRAGAGGDGAGVRRGSGVVRRAAMLLSSTTEAANLLVAGGAEALAAVGLAVGTPIQPMLAASAPGPEAALTKSGAAGDRRRQAGRHPGAGAPSRRRRADLHPIAGRDHRAAARGRGGRADDRRRRAGARRRGAGAALRRTTGGLPAGGLADRHPLHRRRPGLALRVFFFDVLHVDGRTLLDARLDRAGWRSWSGCCRPSSGSSARTVDDGRGAHRRLRLGRGPRVRGRGGEAAGRAATPPVVGRRPGSR